MNKFLVITTINHPTEAIRQFSLLKDWNVIVVGDKKTPADWQIENVKYLSIEDQTFFNFNLPFNNYVRKMIGYIYAIQNGADIIADSDDDNYPLENWDSPFNNEKQELVFKKGFLNIYRIFSDEIIWPKGFKDIREVLREANGNVIYTDMWQVYKHHSEMDLDPTLKAIWLRRHGDPNRTKGENARYCKPIVFRSGLNLKWGIGFHDFEPNPIVQISKERFDGAHWMMADPELAIVRRLRGRKEKVSKRNIKNQWSCNNFNITEEEIRRICQQHLDDPQLF